MADTNKSELWVCAACGKEGASRYDLVGSCGTYPTRVDPATVERDERGRVVRAVALEDGE
jgi:hypothetical protein